MIEKAEQTCPAPTLAAAATNSLTLNTVDNAEYSMDGQVWQDSPVFKNLDAGTGYTLYQRLKATEDGNYDSSPTVSARFTTVDPGDLNAVLQPQTHPVPVIPPPTPSPSPPFLGRCFLLTAAKHGRPAPFLRA